MSLGARYALRCTLLLATGWASSCAPAGAGPNPPQPEPTASGVDADTAGLSGARGTLGQRDITVELSVGDLQIQVTPLEDWVLRATAPDTQARLKSLATLYETALAEESGDSDPMLLLVSFFTEEATQSFEPEFLQIIARGVRARPLAIEALTPNWHSRRLAQRSTETAVYAFAGSLDITRDMGVEYDGVTNDEWRLIVTRIEAELR